MLKQGELLGSPGAQGLPNNLPSDTLQINNNICNYLTHIIWILKRLKQQ